jgi:hypothetical protein
LNDTTAIDEAPAPWLAKIASLNLRPKVGEIYGDAMPHA